MQVSVEEFVKISSHSLLISLYSAVCIVDVLYWEGRSFFPPLDLGTVDTVKKNTWKYFFSERTVMYLLGWHVCSQSSQSFFFFFCQNCFVMFLQINEFLFKDLLHLYRFKSV